MERCLAVAVVGKEPRLKETAHRVFSRLGLVNEAPSCLSHGTDTYTHATVQIVQDKSRAFLQTLKTPVHAMLICGDDFSQLLDRLTELYEQDKTLCLGMCFVDLPSLCDTPHEPGSFSGMLDEFYGQVLKQGIDTMRSPYSDVVYIAPQDYHQFPYQSTTSYRVRVQPDEDWMLVADLMANSMNYLQHTFTSRLSRKRLHAPDKLAPLGEHLAHFLTQRRGSDWLLSYYTGSVVSSLIRGLDDLAGEAGVYRLRGPNEHSLACGALINWRLYQRPHLIVLTSGMLDEFRGTLANLQQAGAKGFIISAEARENKWFGFQATIGTPSDTRRILETRGIPYVYLQDPEDVGPGLTEAFRLYEHTAGPVVILATPQVLEARERLACPPSIPHQAPAAASAIAVGMEQQALLDDVVHMINQEDARLLWQCGALDPEELGLTLDIAERAGIGLCDALSAPGYIPAFQDGRPVGHYLGMLGQYGTSEAVFSFLHENGRLRPKEQQCLFFLKSKIAQIDSPFSDGDHARRLRIVQINRNPDHLAPFSDYGLSLPLKTFLQYVRSHLNVDITVLNRRLDALELARTPQCDAIAQIPTLPMTPNYFFEQLRGLLTALIADERYRYTGMYDVGHTPTLAMKHLPCTDPGYSGWYGRGLMGDALQAAASLAFTSERNVLAFVGDGARHIVPDILPNMLENLSGGAHHIRHNVSIFYFVNNTLQAINAYQERMMIKRGGRQMTIVHHPAFMDLEERSTIVEGVYFYQTVLREFDAKAIRQALSEPQRVNLFFVPVLSTTDGIAILLDKDNWQYANSSFAS